MSTENTEKPSLFDITRNMPGVSVKDISTILELYFQMPIERMAAQKGTWTELLLFRAILRLRRLYPNSYEELKAKRCKGLWYSTWQVTRFDTQTTFQPSASSR